MNTTRPAMLGNINILVKKPSQAKYRPIFTPKYFLIASSGWYLYHWPKEPQTLESLLRPESSESFFLNVEMFIQGYEQGDEGCFFFWTLNFLKSFYFYLCFLYCIRAYFNIKMNKPLNNSMPAVCLLQAGYRKNVCHLIYTLCLSFF